MKKIRSAGKAALSLLLCCVMLSCTTFAADSDYAVDINKLEAVEIYENNGIIYKYTKLSNPVSFAKGEQPAVVLGYIEVLNSEIMPLDEYHESTVYTIIDYGIDQFWVDMSKPFFIRSVARGETYEKSKGYTVSINAKYDGNMPSGAKNMVQNAMKGKFTISFSGSYTVKETIMLSGPDEGYSSRTFFYLKGYHQHDLEIQYVTRYQGTILDEGSIWCKGYEPASKHDMFDE